DESITARRRSSALHSMMSGELFSRMVVVSVTSGGAIAAFALSLQTFRGVVTGIWQPSLIWSFVFVPPFSLWLVASGTVVLRLLNYLDTRIRLEGWEVELLVRAEAARLRGDAEVRSA
ncbi:MAG: hypothetical protein AAF664_05660, partial [Planctomycetota bacterium]